MGAYFRDLKDFVQVFCIAGHVSHAGGLPADMVPARVSPAAVAQSVQLHGVVLPGRLLLRPLRSILGRGRCSWCGSLATFYLGYRVFRKMKICFGNVL